MNLLRNYAWTLSIAAMAALGLTGCGGSNGGESGNSTADVSDQVSDAALGEGMDREEGGRMVWFELGEPAMLQPHHDMTQATGTYVSSYIFEAMINVDPDTLLPIPHIAKSWEISDDHLSYTFHLRDDVVFSDGTPLTAHDVKFNVDAIVDPNNETAAIRSYLVDIVNCEVVDDHTVRINVSKPYWAHLFMIGGLDILPKHIYGKGDFNSHPNNRKPLGSGPYTFESWDTGQRIVLKRNPNYWNEETRGWVDDRIFQFVTDKNAGLQLLLKGDIDVMEMDGDMWNRHASKPDFVERFHKLIPDSPVPGYLSRYNYIGWNTRKPQFSDKMVRRALTMLFDRQLVIDTVWGGLGTIITGSYYHKLPEYNKDLEPWPFDPEGAAKLLDEAGWIDSDNDGIRDKDGVPFSFELSYTSGIQEYEQLGTVYQEELKRAGIDLKLNPMEWATFIEGVHDRSFDACMLAWLTTVVTDPYQLWHSTQAEQGSNYPGLKIDELDKLIEDSRTEFDRDKRLANYHRVHEILHDEQPYIFLYARPGMTAASKRYHGTVVHNAGIDPTEWWVPAAQQLTATP